MKSPRSPPPSPRFVRLSFYSLAFLFAIPYGALNSVNQTSQAVFGGAPGASPAIVSLADDLSRTANVVLSASWLVFLFFVPALLQWMRGARNAFAVMMFAWTGAGAMLVGAFALSLPEGRGGPGGEAKAAISAGVTTGMRACAVLFGLLVGVFGGLGYTATEVYLDTCAEWMPLSLDAAGKTAGATQGVSPSAQTMTPRRTAAATGLRSPPRPSAAWRPRCATSLSRRGTRTFLPATYTRSWRLAPSRSRCPALWARSTDPDSCTCSSQSRRACWRGRPRRSSCPTFGIHRRRGRTRAATSKRKQARPTPEAGGGAPPAASCFAAVGAAVADAGASAVRSVTCLSAYNGLAALAIVPYFLSAAYADNYFQFVVLGTQCGLQAKPAGIGLEGANAMALFGSVVQAVAAFAGPALVGPRRFQFREHVAPLALGNLCGAAGALLVVALGGLTPRLCASLPLMLATKALSSIAFGINNSVGVAAVLCWYSGRYQPLVVAALASRSVWTQLGGIIGPYTFGDGFATLSGGAPAAWFAAAVYAAGSVCVVAAHVANETMQRRRLQRLRLEPIEVSEAQLRLARAEGKMTAGFSDAPAAAAYRESLAAAAPGLRRRRARG